jgi:hypothetical protein
MHFEVVLGVRYERNKGIERGVVSFVPKVGSDSSSPNELGRAAGS